MNKDILNRFEAEDGKNYLDQLMSKLNELDEMENLDKLSFLDFPIRIKNAGELKQVLAQIPDQMPVGLEGDLWTIRRYFNTAGEIHLHICGVDLG